MSKFKEDWLLQPFETPEGLTEVWLYDECWGANIHFASNTKSHDVISKWMERVFKIKDLSKFVEISGQAEVIHVGYAEKSGIKAIVIHFPLPWEETPENIFMLCHESAHAAFKILSSKGIKHNEETEEAFCYFQESIVRRLVEAMRKKVIPFKNSPDATNKNTIQRKKKGVTKNVSNRSRIKKS